jgi:hypothetical protein
MSKKLTLLKPYRSRLGPIPLEHFDNDTPPPGPKPAKGEDAVSDWLDDYLEKIAPKKKT